MLLELLKRKITVSTANGVEFNAIALPRNWEKAIALARAIAPHQDVEIRTNDLSVIGGATIGKQVRPGVYKVTWLDLVGPKRR